METDCLQTVRAANGSSLRNATSQKVSVGSVLLHIRMGDARIKAVLRVLRDLAVPIVLRKSFIKTSVKEIFPPEHSKVLYNSASVLIVVTVVRTEDS